MTHYMDPEEAYALRHELAPLINDTPPECGTCGAPVAPDTAAGASNATTGYKIL